MKAAKRSALYRQYRTSLACRAPSDVWREDESNACFVLFPLKQNIAPLLSALGFVVDAADMTLVSVSVVGLGVSSAGWRVRTERPDDVLPVQH